MKKAAFLFVSLVTFYSGKSQHVGIGTATPTGPLSFANNTGNKIIFWGNGAQPHIGIGLADYELQIYTHTEAMAIALGYGKSTAFNERVRIINNGIDAMNIKGRVHLLNANPANAASGAGIWLYKPDNSASLGFMGTQNSQNIGFYGGTAGWGFTYDAINSRVGIGNNTPAVKLDIGGTDGWDLVNGEGDMRIGNSSYRIKLGIALGGGGVGAAGIMQAGGIGNLAIGAGLKYLLQMNGPGGYVDFTNNTGGIRINGSAGSAGQVLTSNGNGLAAGWEHAGKALANDISYTELSQQVIISSSSIQQLTELNQTIQLFGPAKLLITVKAPVYNIYCFGCGDARVEIISTINGEIASAYAGTIKNAEEITIGGTSYHVLGAGTHNIRVSGYKLTGPDIRIGASAGRRAYLIVQVLRQ